MKTFKKIICLSLLVGLVVISRSHTSNNPIESLPETTKPHQSASVLPEATAQPASTNQALTKDTNNTTVDTSKHPSRIIEENPTAPEVPYYLLATSDDPLLSADWAHAKVQADRAWDLTTGSDNSVVAIIDTGFAMNHEDLENKWFINQAEVGITKENDRCWTGTPADKQTNNCDDDSNGYKDDWRGYDFFNKDNNPQAGQVNPDGDGTYHGSLVAGVVGARANNKAGSAGIDQSVRLMPLQVFSDDSEASTTDVVAAIEYAANNGANVINLSLGSNGYDAPLLSAIIYARNHGVLVVAASGNCALNDQPYCNSLLSPGRMTYPALYPETFAVGSTSSTDQRASSSSYGNMLDITAPGDNVGPLPYYTAANQTNLYASASGTSFASPLVAGIASLLIAQKSDISLDQLEFLLTTGVDKPASMNGSAFSNEFGYGRINAHRTTLLGLAKTQDNLLGDRELSPKEPAIGNIWRAATGNINSDESILIGCRVFDTDECSATIQNGAIYRFNAFNRNKAGALQYIFVKASEVPAGNWSIAVHNREFAKQLTVLTKQ